MITKFEICGNVRIIDVDMVLYPRESVRVRMCGYGQTNIPRAWQGKENNGDEEEKKSSGSRPWVKVTSEMGG